ncbi:MAG: class I tRNA ligase family protein, partial [Proteobacteria bacterium]|nr:class I tRNA ligase family protein [Pseudomonadota bacterium]
WFVKVSSLAEKAIKAVENGETKIIPESWTKNYFNWMNEIRDWCISRQIWWGHQIPAWTCENCNKMVIAMDTPETCPKCGGKNLVQESDVLDTWFSSALWPFSTMGWPEQTPLLKTFYPTSVLITGFDILFFWVARMMMMGLHFMGDVPFKDVYIHALVRDEEGSKMSKSKGNVIDPLTVIEHYGTDAFRFTLAAFAAQGRDIKMSEKRVEGYRNFVNKLWNASRFSLMHLDKSYDDIEYNRLSLPDRWILSRLNSVTETVNDALENYRFNDAAGTIYKFVWHEFCDWYLEIIKPVLYGKERQNERQSTLRVLWRVLHDILLLLHPFMPFVTEEIWHKLPGTEGSIMKASFPATASDYLITEKDPEAESKMKVITEIISGIRNIRGEMNIAPSLTLEASVQSQDELKIETIRQYQDIIINLARLKSFSASRPEKKPNSSATAIVNGDSIFVSLEGIIDFAKEAGRLEKEINKLAKELSAVSNKLSNENFLNKAPADVVEKVKEKNMALLEKQQKLQANLEKIKKFEAK